MSFHRIGDEQQSHRQRRYSLLLVSHIEWKVCIGRINSTVVPPLTLASPLLTLEPLAKPLQPLERRRSRGSRMVQIRIQAQVNRQPTSLARSLPRLDRHRPGDRLIAFRMHHQHRCLDLLPKPRSEFLLELAERCVVLQCGQVVEDVASGRAQLQTQRGGGREACS